MRDYRENKKGLKQNELAELLPHDMLNSLHTVILQDPGAEEDERHWKPSPTGKLTIESAYALST